jgi:uncharacterized membrane protein
MDLPTQHSNNSHVAAALLSAVGLSETTETRSILDSGQSAALCLFAGLPFIEFQIEQLTAQGINRILLEIDSLPGSLVAIVDRARENGVNIELVRSPSELKDKIPVGQLLFVLSDGVYLDPSLLAEISSQEKPFIATLDGREENSAFERIDLNSFWSGVAMLDSASVAAIASLPDEWSISSTLLRRALQDSVTHRPLKQDLCVSRRIAKVNSDIEIRGLTDQILRSRMSNEAGLIERYIFAPIAAWIVPLIWKSQRARFITNLSKWALAVAAAAFAATQSPVIAAISAIAALLANEAWKLSQSRRRENKLLRLQERAFWIILLLGIFAAFSAWPQRSIYDLFVPAIVSGLLVLANNLEMSRWFGLMLKSPGLIAIAFGVFALFDSLLIGIMVMSIGQLAGLIAATFRTAKIAQG